MNLRKIKDYIIRPFPCLFKHKWYHHVVNITVQDDPGRPLTVAFKECPRCGKSKWIFVYSNLPIED